MSNLVITNAVLNGEKVDALITDSLFAQIGRVTDIPDGTPVLDARGMILAPAFYNCHTHSAMSTMRGLADDIKLEIWLNEHIWPYEAKLTEDMIRDGLRLACEEMIRSGTVFFNDMYWMSDITLEVADEMGMRAVAGPCLIKNGLSKFTRLEQVEKALKNVKHKDRLSVAYAPHAVYTTDEEMLRDVAAKSANDGRCIHIHASETEFEVAECIKAYGMTPIAWLDHCGVLTDKTILAHCVHLTPEDIEIIAERKSVIVHNPCSNYKICSGQMDYKAVFGKCRLSLGTDGCASNNNLSMFDEMKLAAFNAKIRSGDPECGKAEDIWRIATSEGAAAFGLNGGKIEVGALGDAILLDPNRPQMRPVHNLAANVVYSADTSCVDSVVCGGDVLLEHGVMREMRETADARRSDGFRA